MVIIVSPHSKMDGGQDSGEPSYSPLSILGQCNERRRGNGRNVQFWHGVTSPEMVDREYRENRRVLVSMCYSMLMTHRHMKLKDVVKNDDEESCIRCLEFVQRPHRII